MPERLLGGFWGPILVKRKEQQLEGAEGEVEMWQSLTDSASVTASVSLTGSPELKWPFSLISSWARGPGLCNIMWNSEWSLETGGLWKEA